MDTENTSGGDFDFGSAMDEVAKEVMPAMADESEGAAAAPSPAPAPAPAPEPAASPTPAPVVEHPYPKSWRPDHQSQWANLPPEIRAEVLRREDDFHKGTAPLRSAAQFVQRFQQASAPVAEYLNAGVDPLELYANFAKAHATLSRGGPEASEFLRTLAAEYKLDLSAEPAYVDPQLKALQDEVRGVKSVLSAQEQAVASAKRAELTSEVDRFAADPQNKHFPVVAADMALLLKADAKLTLADAYAKATWASPAVRDLLLGEELEKRRKTEKEASAQRAAQSAHASQGSVRNSARTAPATGAVGTMDDTMKDVLKGLRSAG